MSKIINNLPKSAELVVSFDNFSAHCLDKNDFNFISETLYYIQKTDRFFWVRSEYEPNNFGSNSRVDREIPAYDFEPNTNLKLRKVFDDALYEKFKLKYEVDFA